MPIQRPLFAMNAPPAFVVSVVGRLCHLRPSPWADASDLRVRVARSAAQALGSVVGVRPPMDPRLVTTHSDEGITRY